MIFKFSFTVKTGAGKLKTELVLITEVTPEVKNSHYSHNNNNQVNGHGSSLVLDGSLT